MEPGYKRHVFFCGHERTPGHKRGDCKSKSSLEMMTKLKRRSREEGIKNIRVQKSGCLNYCEQGVSCVIYPEGVWYSIKSEEDLEKVWNHIITGEKSDSILMRLD
ncbi:MAG: ferredoxin [Euryarchaeota archaeon]|nr:ferredoxin [Euryarchaeota archaeon]|tara:strand:+ start:1802 stop:2116 length:315 start_codon:yes stop_codon:yes gene_type:complete